MKVIMRFSELTGESKIIFHNEEQNTGIAEKAFNFLDATLGDTSDFNCKAEWYKVALNIGNYFDSNLCG